MYADRMSSEDSVLAMVSVWLQPILSWTKALDCGACSTRSPASPQGWQDWGKSSSSSCGGTFHLKALWKGQQGLPKPVVPLFPWVEGRWSRT